MAAKKLPRWLTAILFVLLCAAIMAGGYYAGYLSAFFAGRYNNVKQTIL